MQEDKRFLKIFTVPIFEQTHSIVLLDTATCQTYEVTFSPPVKAPTSQEEEAKTDEKMVE